MFGGSRFEAIRRSFTDQFHPSGDGFHFRRSARGEVVVITAAQHDRFVRDFDRGLWAIRWIGIPVAVLIALGVVLGGVALDLAEPWMTVAIFVGSLGPPIGMAGIFLRLYTAPARDLARRGR